jgi:hypothetical protein
LKDCTKSAGAVNPDDPSAKPTVDKIRECMGRQKYNWHPSFTDEATITFFLKMLCGYMGSKKDGVCIRCFDRNNQNPGWGEDCYNPCAEEPGLWGMFLGNNDEPDMPTSSWCGLKQIPLLNRKLCDNAFKDYKGQNCSCLIVLCDAAFHNGWEDPCAIMWHELAHCGGLGHDEGEKPPPGVTYVPRTLDFVYKLGCCVCLATRGEGRCGHECNKIYE